MGKWTVEGWMGCPNATSLLGTLPCRTWELLCAACSADWAASAARVWAGMVEVWRCVRRVCEDDGRVEWTRAEYVASQCSI